MLGKVAEAVLVRRCSEDLNINREWLSIARRITTRRSTAEAFCAIGTELRSTKRHYPQKYNPSDPQRDIIWINKNGELATMQNAHYMAAIPAGLQVKVSGNGANYILKALKEQRYEVPMAYFPMQNDYESIFESVCKSERIEEGFLEGNFINVRNVDDNAFIEVRNYFPILVRLYTGELSATEFVNEAIGIAPIRNSILAGALTSNATDIRIIR